MRIRVKGIPSNVGALNPGTESAPQVIREAHLIEALDTNHEVIDMGDVELPKVFIRHNVAPIRNWPSPRLVWEETMLQLTSCFSESDFTLIIGGGCSVFTGVFNQFHKIYGMRAKIISLDHHIDIKEPSAETCMGATAYTHWFLTSHNQWFTKPSGFTKAGIIALGYNEDTIGQGYNISGIIGYSKNSITQNGVENTLKDCLSHLNPEDRVLVHLDLDIIQEDDLQSVYMPSPSGMELSVVQALLKGIVSDSRVMGIVITEFSGAHENSKHDAKKVVNLITHMFKAQD